MDVSAEEPAWDALDVEWIPAFGSSFSYSFAADVELEVHAETDVVMTAVLSSSCYSSAAAEQESAAVAAS